MLNMNLLKKSIQIFVVKLDANQRCNRSRFFVTEPAPSQTQPDRTGPVGQPA